MALVGPEVIEKCPEHLGRSNPGCEIVGPLTRGELTTGVDFHLSCHVATGRCLLGECLSKVSCMLADNLQRKEHISHVASHRLRVASYNSRLAVCE